MIEYQQIMSFRKYMEINILLIGDKKVGKISILNLLQDHQFPTSGRLSRVISATHHVDNLNINIRCLSNNESVGKIPKGTFEDVTSVFMVIKDLSLPSINHIKELKERIDSRCWPRFFISDLIVTRKTPIILLVNGKIDTVQYNHFVRNNGFHGWIKVLDNVDLAWKEMVNLIKIQKTSLSQCVNKVEHLNNKVGYPNNYIRHIISGVDWTANPAEILVTLGIRHIELDYYPEYEQMRNEIRNNPPIFEIMEYINQALTRKDVTPADNVHLIFNHILKSGSLVFYNGK